MNRNNKGTEKLLREIVAAYRATQSNPMGTNEHIKHLRYQIARLTRVCIDMNHRIDELEEKIATQTGNRHVNEQEEMDVCKVTALGDII